MATKEELQGLQNLASQYGGADSQQFKDYVNQTAGAGSYDKLMAGLKKQASVQTAPMNNVGKIDTTTGQEVQQPIQNQPITTPTPTQAPNIPQTIQEAPKSEVSAPKVEVKTDINEAINPKWEQSINTALESGQDVKSKLDEGLKAGTIDQVTYNQANNYLKQKEQIAGNQKEQQLNDENYIFDALQTGQNLKGTTPAYNQALNRYNKMNYYKSLSDSQLGAELGRNLLPGTTEYNDLIKDPVFKEKLTKLQQINIARGVKVNQEDVLAEKNYEILNNTNVNIAGTNFTLGQALEDGYITSDEMSSLTNSPVIATKAQEVEDLKNQYDEAYSLYKNLATDVKNQFKGTGATRRDIAIAVANAQEKLLPGLEALENRYINALGTLTQMRTDSVQLFATNLGLYKEQQAKSERMREIEMQRQFQLEDRAYQEQLAQKQLEQKFAYEYGDINSTDENVQRVAFERIAEDLQKQYAGMPFRRTVSEMAMDFMNEYKNGKSLSDISAETTQAIQNAPAYSQWAMNKGLTAKETTTQDWAKLSDTELYNQRTGEIKSITPKQAGVIDLQVGDIGGQCGTYARQYTGITTGLDAVVGTTAKDRVKNFTDTEPKEGGLVLFTGGNYDKQYGHIAVVTSVNGDGTINITESNLNNDLKVTTRTVGVDEVTGFYNDTPLAGGTGGYTQDKIELLAEIAQIQSETEKRKALEGSGFTLQDLTKYKSDASAGRIPPTEGQKQAALKTISDIQGIAKTDWTDATGRFDYSRLLGLQGATDAGVLIENLRDVASFNNLGMLKGPMSDKDIAFLKSVSSKLDPRQSNKQFEKNIVEMYNIAARKAGLTEITKLSEVPKDRILPGQGQTAQPAQTIQTNQGDYSEEDLLNSLK